ncbi:pyridoxal-dependent decarboxylase [Sphingomonas sp. AOB5]|uniref:pyridoxal phosphate-dependent decarboxylase family protein n=1 Tax=Sphingomonas sp. AOB5 TaxID=3034017 RepID=UPI0023F646C8|nr:pyridoxal-dependent decarboxylase [Sphingomonas sp. AOB5]MDF7776064.1 pyridoxal-dependent decarboxylase [Sphingomonas sp. AOB5]
MSDHPAMRRAADAAIAYRRDIASAQTTPVADYAAMLTAFAGPVPESGGDPDAIIAELIDKATPGIRASTGPRFFGWVIGNSHPTGVAADWLTSAWGQNGGNLIAAPAASAVEKVAADWLLDLLHLPAASSVGFVTGATVANFVCLAAARSEMLARAGWDVEADGMFGAPPVEVVIGADAHATVYSGLKYLGLGAKRVKIVESNASGRMIAGDFERVLKACTGPVIAIAQAGQINTGACDRFAEIAPIAKQAGAWLHVDGAFGLWAQASPEKAHLTAGVEAADSWATDGHKWLQTPYDCGFAIVRDAEAHRRAMAISASYLPPAEGAERDPSAYVPELSRRARGFATWAMIRQLGREGIAHMVECHSEIARHMGERLADEAGIELVAPVELNQFMVRFGNSDDLTLATVRQVQDDAVAFIGSAQWRGQWVMRVSVTSIATTMAEADVTVDAVIDAWRRVRG